MNYNYEVMRLLALVLVTGVLAAQDLPVTGVEVPSLASFDQAMVALLQKYHAPGGSLAVIRDGKLILARGYGWADVEGKVPVQPDSLFRIASLSKVFTATGIMKLVEEGKLSLDRPALELLDTLKPAPGQALTPGFAKVTVRQLLWHAGGWDRDKTPGGYDPMFQNASVTRALGVPSPATCTDVIRWMMSRPLDFDPGQKYAYSNFGYCILGRIIERVSGLPYEIYMQQNILAPLGIGRMSIGASLFSGRKPAEVKYYDYPGAPLAVSVFPEVTGNVPGPYGAWDLRALDSHGGWIASAIDIVRLIKGLDFDLPGMVPFLQKETVLQMLARPAPPIAAPGDAAFYGFGMQVRPGAGDGNWWHSGSLPGTGTYFVRDGRDRMAWAMLINFRDQRSAMFTDLDVLGWNSVAKVTSFPSQDLFPLYRSAPQLAASRQSVSIGPPYEEQQISVTSALAEQDFTLSTSGQAWLKAASSGMRTPATVRITASPAGLPEGIYRASVSLTTAAPNANTVVIDVVMDVTSVPVIASIRNAATHLDGPIAPGSLAEIAGANLTGTTITVQDGGAIVPDATGRFVVPSQLAPGSTAKFIAALPDGRFGSREVAVENTSPGLFSASIGDGVITLLATGLRNQTDLGAFVVLIGDQPADILTIGPSPDIPGVDTVRVQLPNPVMAEYDIVLTVDGKTSNALHVGP